MGLLEFLKPKHVFEDSPRLNERVLGIMKEIDATPEEIAEQLGVEVDTVIYVLNRLEYEGLIRYRR